jgi:asparagine synthase (glutamine-hydrolysing)
MCGIAALVAAPDCWVRDALVAMTRIVAHRGPDGEGHVAFGGTDLRARGCAGEAPTPATVALGHRRLSIVDLSDAGRQPMASADGRCWIVYNGEVYNHVELRTELASLGHRFVSSSDTEVVLTAYRQWGEDCVHRFNGMFAFALVDRTRRILWAVRDRFGVKPLYWWRAPSGFLALASEIKQFTVLPGWCARLNGARARDFLVAGAYDHTDETLFAGVRQLHGGEAMTVSLDDDEPRPRIRRWYALAAHPFSGSFEEAAAQFRTLLSDAVRLQLRADVPVGSCLSGGLDSSAIVCLAGKHVGSENRSAPTHAFSAVSDSPRYDERRYAEAVAARAGFALHTVEPSPGALLGALDALVWAQDEPFGSTSILAQAEVFRLAAQHGVKVMLDGQGADEALGGYPVFRGAAIAELLLSARWWSALQEIFAGGTLLARLLASGLVRSAMRSRERRHAFGWLDLERLDVGDEPTPALTTAAARRSFAALSREQLLRTSLPALLHWEDRSSMMHSIEARVPFLDHRLVEFVLGLPTHFKYASGLTKRILRESLADLLPPEVTERRDKLGFQLAEDEWMRAQPGPVRAALQTAAENSEGVIRPEVVGEFERFLAGRRRDSFFFVRVLSFGAWMRRFQVTAP